MNEKLMECWVVVQERTMRIIGMYNSKLRMGDMSLRRALIIPCHMLLREHFKSTRIVSLIGSGSGRVDGCVGCTLKVLVVSIPLSWAYLFPWAFRLNWDSKSCT